MNNLQPTNGQPPQMDPNTAGRVMNLYNRIDEVLNELKVSDDERAQVQQNLMEAIAADLMVRLGAKMNDDQKDRLNELTQGMTVEPNLADVAMFFRDSFKPEDLIKDLGDATETVLDAFIKEMGK